MNIHEERHPGTPVVRDAHRHCRPCANAQQSRYQMTAKGMLAQVRYDAKRRGTR